MRSPIYVRPRTDAERAAVETGLRSTTAFTLRRSQIIAASARGEQAPRIAQSLGCDAQTVRNAIHAFDADGSAALTNRSSRVRTAQAAFSPAAASQLPDLLHRSPREFGHPTSRWTLELAAAEAHRHGLTGRPRSGVCAKKRRRDRLIRWAQARPDWLRGFEDEVWWSRLATPALHAWADEDRPLRLVEQAVAPDDPDQAALACYGVLLPELDEVWLRFLDGRPLSAVTTVFLAWCAEAAARRGYRALLLVWDNASWHGSKAVRAWIAAHNRTVKQTGRGARLIVCPLPSKSPWLNPIEPR
jgi:hypothetical protein